MCYPPTPGIRLQSIVATTPAFRCTAAAAAAALQVLQVVPKPTRQVATLL